MKNPADGNIAIANPREFLQKKEAEAKKTMTLIKSLRKQIGDSIKQFNSPGKTVLFRDDTLNIKGHASCWTYYIINGIEITATPQDNNCLDNRILCFVNIWISLLLDYDPENKFGFDRAKEGKAEWSASYTGISLQDGDYQGQKWGRVGYRDSRSEDEEISIDDFSQFTELKNTIIRGLEEIGLGLLPQ